MVERDLSHYVLAGLVSKKLAKQVTVDRLSLIKELAKESDNLLDCLSVPTKYLYAPIAADYVKYNAGPNKGEVIGAKM